MKEDTNKMIAISALFTQKFKNLRYHDAVPNTLKEILLNDAHIFTELSDLHILSILLHNMQALKLKALKSSECKNWNSDIIPEPQLTTSNFLSTVYSKFYSFTEMNIHYRQHALSHPYNMSFL